MPESSRRLELFAPDGIPEIQHQAPLPRILANAFAEIPGGMKDGDIVVVAQKIVSKSEGRQVLLEKVEPSQTA